MFAKQHGCASKSYGFIGILCRYRLCTREALRCAYPSAVHKDITHWYRLYTRGNDSIGTFYMTINQESRITAVHQREQQQRVRLGSELRRTAREQDHRRRAGSMNSPNH